jgi:hypothetical protein
MEPREEKAILIAAKSKIVRKNNSTWIVPSQSGPKKYTVNPNPEAPNCSCPDFEARQLPCKHIMAVTIVYRREYCDDGETQTVRESVTVTKTYSQHWSSYNKAQVWECQAITSCGRTSGSRCR